MAHPGHVYHWKHGWIPLDHTAALSKAKGDHKKAAELLGAAKSPTAGISNKQDVAKAVLDFPNISGAAERRQARLAIVAAADKYDAPDALPSSWQPDLRALREQRAITNAHAAAREAPNPSAADLSKAAEMWKADNPGKKLAGNESEIQRIAEELWRKKRRGGDTSMTAQEIAAETERKRKAASHYHTFKNLDLGTRHDPSKLR